MAETPWAAREAAAIIEALLEGGDPPDELRARAEGFVASCRRVTARSEPDEQAMEAARSATDGESLSEDAIDRIARVIERACRDAQARGWREGWESGCDSAVGRSIYKDRS